MRQLHITLLLITMLLPGTALANSDSVDTTTETTSVETKDTDTINKDSVGSSSYLEGKVLDIIYESEQNSGNVEELQQPTWEQTLKVKVTYGQNQGEEITFDHLVYHDDFVMEVGDKITMTVSQDINGNQSYQITGRVRRHTIYWLLFLMIVLAVAIGRLETLRSLLGAVLSIALIFKVLLPKVLGGGSPVLWAILICSGITLLAVPIALGLTKKALTTIIGVLAGLFMTLIASSIASSVLNISGFEDEDAFFLMNQVGQNFDFRGIILAGALIASLGALIDSGISVASSMEELRKSVEPLIPSNMFKSGMNIARDIIGSMINTLTLAYVGTALPMLLLFMARDLSINETLNLDFLATEIVRTFAGSLGVIVAVPVSVAVASITMSNTEPARTVKHRNPSGKLS